MKKVRFLVGSTLAVFALAGAAMAFQTYPPGYKPPKPIEVKVKFLDPNGKPFKLLEMVHVSVRGNSGWSVMSIFPDKDGIGKLTMVSDGPEENLFVAEDLGYAKLKLVRKGLKPNSPPKIVKLQSGTYVKGKITDTNGRPLGGVMVFPKRHVAANDPWQIWNKMFGVGEVEFTISDAMAGVSSDSDGSYSIGPLPPGQYDLSACFPNNRMTVAKTIRLDVPRGKNSIPTDVSISLNDKVSSLSGRLSIEKDGSPVANASISIELTPQLPGIEPNSQSDWFPMPRRVKTDSQGNFDLYPVIPGNYNVKVLWNHHPLESLIQADSFGSRMELKFSEQALNIAECTMRRSPWHIVYY